MKRRGKICTTHFSRVNLGIADIRLPAEPICNILPAELRFSKKCLWVVLQICLIECANILTDIDPVDQNLCLLKNIQS